MKPDDRDKTTISRLFGSDGQAVRLMAEVDWRSHPLGPPEHWPLSLRLTLRNMLASPESVYIVWGEHRAFFFNDVYIPILASRAGHATGMRFEELWPDAFPLVAGPFHQALSGKASRAVDMHVSMEQWGEDRDSWWTYSFAPLYDEDGAVAGVQCITSETTENVLRADAEHRAIIALETSERRLRRAQEAGQIGIFAIDLLTNSLTGTPEFYRLFGLPQVDSVRAEAIEALVIPDDQGVISHAEGRSSERIELHVEYRIRRPDNGEIRWIERRGEFERDEQGRAIRLLGVVQDVTERQAGRAALAELNATLAARVKERTEERNLLARIIEETDNFVYVADHDYRWLAVNRAGAKEFERIFGGQIRVGDRIHDSLAHQPNELAAIEHIWGRALAGEEFTIIAEFGDLSRIGERRTYEVKFNTLRDDDGQQIGAFQVVSDITERVRAEAAYRQMQETLRQSQKMEAMGQLTGGVAHDFNNLLTPILGSLDLIQRRSNLSEREARLIDGALQSAERAKMLVQRLLAFARRQPLHPGPVEIGRLIKGMAELVASTSGPRITILTEAPETLPMAIADANQLEMAILNLCVNARDAMPEGGTITISACADVASPSGPDGLAPGDYVRLSVTDSGTGMDDETRLRAVEPFYSTKGVGKGTGLGLSMVDGLVSQLGGTMAIWSEIDRGTRVDLWLPASDGLPTAPGLRSDETPTRHFRGRALVVDDEPLVRMTTADMLQELGYETEEAESAIAAEHLLERGLRFDLVVTDHLMPGMSGVELARAIRHNWPDVPVLIVSGYAEDCAHHTDFPRLVKPFRESDLARAISELA